MAELSLLTNFEFLARFAINILFLWILLHQIQSRFSPDRDSAFGFFLFGCGVFLITGLLHNVDMSMGFAFGLFAVFSMLRYRTESISIHNMTYLFLVIVISLLSSMGPITLLELAILHTVVCALAAASELVMNSKRVSCKSIVYDRVDLIKPENYTELLADLCQRTGLNIVSAEIDDINFLRDTAKITVQYLTSTDKSATPASIAATYDATS